MENYEAFRMNRNELSQFGEITPQHTYGKLSTEKVNPKPLPGES